MMLFFYPSNMKSYSYLALGDSYTIGEAVSPDECFPAQLVDLLSEHQNLTCSRLQIIATTGWTTNELLKGIADATPEPGFELVSLLIGVNNQYRSYPKDQYVREFQVLLTKAVELAGGKKDRVFVVAIPDYGCTPFGKEKADTIFTEINWYNGEAARQCLAEGIPFVDVFPISRLALHEPELIAGDQLHPSGKMYERWAKEMLPVATRILTEPAF